MKILLFGIGLAAALALNAPAHADTCNMTPSAFEDMAKENNFDIVEFKGLMADTIPAKQQLQSLKAIIANAVNSDPDKISDFDTLIGLTSDELPGTFAASFKDGCLVAKGTLPKEAFAQMKNVLPKKS